MIHSGKSKNQMNMNINSHVVQTKILCTFSVRQEMAYQGAIQAREVQKSLQSTAEVRYIHSSRSNNHHDKQLVG